ILSIILGLGLIFFGLSKLIHFSFMPTHIYTVDVAIFIDSLSNTGYILKDGCLFELVIGLILIFNIWVSFAFLLLAHIILINFFRTKQTDSLQLYAYAYLYWRCGYFH